MELWVVWLIIGICLIIAEMATLTFYLLWLGVGAFVAGILAWFMPDALLLQVLLGCVVAVGLTLFTKPLTQRMRVSKGYEDVIDDLIYKAGIVIEDIPEDGLGIVKIGNETWSANAKVPIRKGTEVVVISRSSTVVEVQIGKGG